MIRKIPRETSTFHFHNENPRNRRTGDCVIRAIARASAMSWDAVLTGLFEVALEIKSELAYSHCYERYLKQLGWVKGKQPRKQDGTKYTVAEWCQEHPRQTMIVSVSKHLTCIIDGKCNDIWNCTSKTVLNYWTKA